MGLRGFFAQYPTDQGVHPVLLGFWAVGVEHGRGQVGRCLQRRAVRLGCRFRKNLSSVGEMSPGRLASLDLSSHRGIPPLVSRPVVCGFEGDGEEEIEPLLRGESAMGLRAGHNYRVSGGSAAGTRQRHPPSDLAAAVAEVARLGVGMGKGWASWKVFKLALA